MKHFFLLLLLAAGLVACGSKNEGIAFEGGNNATTEMDAAGAPSVAANEPPPPPKAEEAAPEQAPIAATPKQIMKQIIKTAQVRVQVEKLAASTAAVRKLAEQAGGYLSNSAETRSNYEHTVSLTIRVPAVKFEELLGSVLKQGVFVAENNVNAQDVTEEFVDIQSRLKTKRALETRYLELLRQAKTMKDILELEQALQQIREEIESREGRLRYLQSQVGYSTINLVMYEEVPYTAAPETGFWRKLTAGFGNGWGIFLDLVIGFVTLWPLWLVLGIGLWLFKRWRRNRKKRSLPQPTPKEEAL